MKINYANDWVTGLNAMSPPDGFEFPMWQEKNGIITLPDGRIKYVEGTPTVGDLVKPGDVIQRWERVTYYEDENGKDIPEGMEVVEEEGNSVRVAKVTRFETCCCPNIGYFQKYCDDGDMKYHRLLVHWTIVYVPLDAKIKVNHEYLEKDYHWLNDLVYFDGEIRPYYFGSDREVTVLKSDKELPPMQMSF